MGKLPDLPALDLSGQTFAPAAAPETIRHASSSGTGHIDLPDMVDIYLPLDTDPMVRHAEALEAFRCTRARLAL